jgi:hypothetical protein
VIFFSSSSIRYRLTVNIEKNFHEFLSSLIKGKESAFVVNRIKNKFKINGSDLKSIEQLKFDDIYNQYK